VGCAHAIISASLKNKTSQLYASAYVNQVRSRAPLLVRRYSILYSDYHDKKIMQALSF